MVNVRERLGRIHALRTIRLEICQEKWKRDFGLIQHKMVYVLEQLILAGKQGATGYYRVTPVLAALAGADRVLAVARDTAFGTQRQARDQVLDLARQAGVDHAIEVRFEPGRSVAHEADLVTNLGAVRPVDAAFADRLRSPRAAVSLMFGACDARPCDIDVAAVRAVGVPVAGVDEEGIDLFRWTGQRIGWWLTELGIELHGARVVVWGDSPQAKRVEAWLGGAGCRVSRSRRVPRLESLAGIDAVIVMDRRARLSSTGSRLRPRALASVAPGACVLEYAGEVDRAACEEAGVLVYPPSAPAGGHVAR